MTIMRGLTTV
jgi:ACS family allantoate permease-like MFS transporter